MSSHQPKALPASWRTVEDVEAELLGASKVSQGPVGTQRANVPPTPVPETRNQKEDPLALFRRRHNGQRVIGRGIMILRRQGIIHPGNRPTVGRSANQDLRGIGVPGCESKSDSPVKQTTQNPGQFDDQEGAVYEPTFSSSPHARELPTFTEGLQNSALTSITDATRTRQCRNTLIQGLQKKSAAASQSSVKICLSEEDE